MSDASTTGPAWAGAPPDVDLDKVWRGVAAEVWRRQPSRLELRTARVLRSPGLARALLTTPSLLVGWLISTTVVLGVGVAATVGSGLPLVALVAPVLAGAGIAYAYGPGMDPAWELSCSMAVSDRMVLLVRAVAVFAVNAGLGLLACAASGLAAPITFGWLVPMTAVAGLALATATVTRSANAGVAAGMAGWAITVLAAESSSQQWGTAVTDSAFVLPYLIFAACCAAVVILATRVPRGAS
jgi:hypothetical protein